MNYSVNPFQELYVADTLSLDHFVKLFSKVPMESLSVMQPLFQVSNVVLLGTQGCGKTMLLSLLRPEIREAYAAQNEPFPVVGEAAQFLSAGVNLTRSALPHVAEVTLGEGDDLDLKTLPYYFADFFNYWVVKDLLENARRIAAKPAVFDNLVNFKGERDFVASLVSQDCWFGSLQGCVSLGDVLRRIQERITCYRMWIGHNIRHKGAPPPLRESKTVVGEPIHRTVECLKQCKVIADVPVFIRVDQIETLHQSPPGRKAEMHLAFRHMLNSTIGRRDLRVSYRLGSRRYGWNEENFLMVHGTGGRLEERRDYLQIDLDEALRKPEHGRAAFDLFAADAFSRRIRYFLQPEAGIDDSSVKKVFGQSPTAPERAEYFGKMRTATTSVSVERALAMESKDEEAQWSPDWRSFLGSLYREDPLQAVLAAAWGRQTGGGRSRQQHRKSPPPETRPFPWERTWWRKERLMLGVLQLAARRGQRMLWWGYQDILSLSSPNITAFLHICHEVWDQFLKKERLKAQCDRINPLAGESIDRLTQAAGIQNASAVWYRKLPEQPGGDIRQRFIERLGNRLRQHLRDDRAMSYPGANGFSVSVAELAGEGLNNKQMWQFLRSAVGYGDLVSADHTTKEKSGRDRIKFYPSPILAPALQLPVAHTKEPLYWGIGNLMELAKESKLAFTYAEPAAHNRPSATDQAQTQLPLFES